LCKLVTPDPLAGLLVAIAAAALLGLLTSFLVLRGSDLTRLMVTLGVALVLHEVANALPQWTGGADGLQGMVVGPLLGRFDFDLYGRTAYAYSLATLFVFFLLARRIVNAPFGLSLMAIRRNTLRASALGVPVNRRLVAVYTLAAAYAGAAGALLAQTTAYVSLEVLEFQRSADVLLALIIGGAGWLYGGLAGAIVFKILQDTLSSNAPQFWMFWMGLFLVVLALVGRERLSGGMRGLLARVIRR
jgi:branched-chain amino acid transport system permease protein